MLNGDGLDQRTSLYKALRDKEQELISSLGGDPSPQEQAIIADSVKNMLYVASLDNYLMQLKSLCAKAARIRSWTCEPSLRLISERT